MEIRESDIEKWLMEGQSKPGGKVKNLPVPQGLPGGGGTAELGSWGPGITKMLRLKDAGISCLPFACTTSAYLVGSACPS
jgi:hypothetical protein